MRGRGPSAVLLGAIVLGAALRWHHLGVESAWLDEAYSIDVARRPLDQVLRQGWTDIHPPLYYVALHAWTTIAGTSESSARLLSTLFDLGTILATWAAARALVGPSAAAIAALILALSPFHVEFAQEARMYALLGLTATLSMYAFTAVVRRRSAGAMAGYVAATTLLVYTHAHAAFVLAAQAAAFGWWLAVDRTGETRQSLIRWLIALSAVFVLFLPWMGVLVNQLSRVHAAFWIPRPAWKDGLTVFVSYAGSRPAALILACFAVLGVIAVIRRRTEAPRGDRAPDVLFTWLVIPILAPLLVSEITTPVFLPKYTIAASIPFAILAASGIVRLPLLPLRAAGVALVAVLSVHDLLHFYGTRRREGWRTAVAIVESLAEPGDVLLFYPDFNYYPFDHYRRRDDLLGVPFPLAPLVPIPAPPALDELLDDTVGDKPRVWLIALQGARERIPIAEGLARSRTELRHIVVEWLEVDLFERPK